MRHLIVGPLSHAAHPQNALGPLTRLSPETPALSGHAIKPNKAQGAPCGPHRDAHSNWQQASGSPGAKDYVLAAGKSQGRVETLREARWDHLASCISHEQLCWLLGALLSKTQHGRFLVWGSRQQRPPLCRETAAGPGLPPATSDCGSDKADFGAVDSCRGKQGRHAHDAGCVLVQL